MSEDKTKNCKWVKVFNERMVSGEHNEEDRSKAMFEITRDFFVKKYGVQALNLIGLSTKENGTKQMERDDVIDIEALDFTIFSQVYENYLSQNRREKTGSFYTPYYITDHIIEKALEIFLSKETGYTQETLCKFFYRNQPLSRVQLKHLLRTMNRIRIIDIACGTGIFLIRCFEKIFDHKKKICKMLGETVNCFNMKKYIVENNLFGIDIQKEPVEITKMVLFSLVYGKDQVQDADEISFNIMVGDSLIDGNLFKSQGFDIVIGNPPYLGEKGNKVIFDKIRSTTFGEKYYEGKMDYFYFFIYKALEILKPKGILAYITTNYFVTADGAEKLRNFLKNHCAFIHVVNFNDYGIFKSAKGQHNIIFFLSKELDQTQSVQVKYIKEKDMDIEEIYKGLYSNKKTTKKIHQYTLANQEKLYDPISGHILIQENNQYAHILKKLYKNSQYTLDELCNINQGIVSGADKVTKSMLEKKFSSETIKKMNVQLDQGIFVLSKQEASELGVLESPYLKPMYKNSDIQRYCARINPSKYILYVWDKGVSDKNALAHLSKYKEVLEKRREIIKGSRPWYGLQWPRNQEIFENTKIIVPHRARINKFALNQSSWYASADVYFITLKDKKIDEHFLLGLLNSKIIYFWLYNRGKRKGNHLELYATPLKNIPIIGTMDKTKYNQIATLVQEMVQTGEKPSMQECVDELFYDLYRLKSKEIKIVEELYKRNIGE